ncbi:MAG: protease complex subunit PrcB family protein [Gammaproteobacteria bacterium]|nr:protease complex subunit PrcB family protein [Gammaproteobacteria bacterium]
MIRISAACFGLALLTACQAAQNNEQVEKTQIQSTLLENTMAVMPEKILSNNTCASGAKNRWAVNAAEYAQLFAQLRGGMLSSPAPQPPLVDFSRYGVLLIAMGQQRTGGYGITLSAQPLVSQGDVAILQIEWQEPSPDMMVIQMLSSPCLLVKVPRGSYSRIQVVDQRNQIRAEVTTR